MTIRHIVAWKIASDDAAVRAEQAAEISRRLHALRSVIPEILALEVGINALTLEDNYDLVLTADYEDAAALQRYVEHPEHQKVVEYVRSVVSDRASVDYQVATLL
jgi:quinol monooxygenase YgiN